MSYLIEIFLLLVCFSFQVNSLCSVSGIILHHGDSLDHGHYTCKLRKDDSWILVNDSKVTNCSYPSHTTLVTNLSAVRKTQTSVTFTWSVPDPESSCNVTEFTYRVFTLDSPLLLGGLLLSGSLSTNTTSTTINRLQPCTIYRMSVASKFLGGTESKNKARIRFRTLPDNIIVRNLTATNVTASTMNVSWTPPYRDTCYGLRNQYSVRLEYYPEKKSFDHWKWIMETNYINLFNCEPSTTYRISVSVLSAGILSDKEVSITQRTLSELTPVNTTAPNVSEEQHSIMDSIMDTLSTHKVAIAILVPVSCALVALTTLCLLLRYRGLTIGRHRFDISEHWCFSEKGSAELDDHSMVTF